MGDVMRLWGATAMLCLAACLISSGARAQDAEQAQTTEPMAEPASATRPAPRLDEVIVTAQKRAEDIQDVPIAMSALGEEELELKGIGNMNEVQLVTPNVSFFTSSYFNLLFVRGMGSDINQGFETSVGLFIDGVYYGRPAYFDQDFFDLERLEILRGPQGAIFGKNTIAGAMNIVNRRPEFGWAANGAYTRSVWGFRRYQLALNAPILEDRLAVRISGNWHDSDGFTRNSEKDGRIEPKERNRYGRAAVRAQVTDRLDVTLQGAFTSIDTDGQGSQVYAATDDQVALFELFDPEFETDPFNNQGSTDADEFGRRDLWMATLTATYDFEGGLSLTMITGLTGYDENKQVDVDFSPAPILILEQEEDYDQISQEIRFTSPLGEHFDWIAGLYFFRSEFFGSRIVQLVPLEDAVAQIPDGLPPGLAQDTFLTLLGAVSPTLFQAIGGQGEGAETSNNFIEQTTTTFSAFFQGNWRFDFLPKLKTTIGGRLTHEIKEASNILDLTGPGQGLLFPAVIPGTEEFESEGRRTETFFLPRFVLAYEWSDDIMSFGQITFGRKAGGFNADAINERETTFEEETSVSYEIGLRSEFFGGLARFNVTGYWSIFNDLQLSAFNGQTYVVRNAAQATTRGVELEFMMAVAPGVIFSGNYAFLDGYYNSFPNAPCPADPGATEQPTDCDLTGKRLANGARQTGYAALLSDQPIKTLSFGLLDWPVNLFAMFEFVFQGTLFNQIDLDPIDSRGNSIGFNARFGVHDPDNVWSVMLSIENLTAEDVFVPGADVPVFAGAHFGGGIKGATALELDVRVKF